MTCMQPMFFKLVNVQEETALNKLMCDITFAVQLRKKIGKMNFAIVIQTTCDYKKLVFCKITIVLVYLVITVQSKTVGVKLIQRSPGCRESLNSSRAS